VEIVVALTNRLLYMYKLLPMNTNEQFQSLILLQLATTGKAHILT
jgi:hypothetical protein